MPNPADAEVPPPLIQESQHMGDTRTRKTNKYQIFVQHDDVTHTITTQSNDSMADIVTRMKKPQDYGMFATSYTAGNLYSNVT